MTEKTRYVVERFPDLAYAVKQYSSDNRFFHGLCEDYGEAVEALRQCYPLDNPVSCERAEACRALILDLEREILDELHQWNDAS
jgi:hypothetical protein